MSIMTNQNQEKFLNHLAKRLGRDRKSGVTSPKHEHFPWDHLYQDLDQNGFINQFIKNLQDIGGHVKRVSSDMVTKEIDQIIVEHQAKKVITWDDPDLEGYQLEKHLQGKAEYVKWDINKKFDSLVPYAEQSQIGITMADLGLSETGTIMLFNQGGRGRSVSLLPEVHIAILPAEKIVPRITQAMKKIKETLNEKGQLPSLINFISGPSRTSDIEMVLTIGVHGPKKLYVLVVD
ncbi:lactate utilization protein C [Tepidibacillus sp. HK-1]|uniref:LutC/YkgG family protein n=1 Tax=Tepidibacillus sp. HK-1 TaxID=1883407 RepID=UPI000856818F|nr:lactate utilization protein C [Tepidibacillus sp. HK-1]GBF12268.1 lactate utilization protein C [Tepidibacillus sp. HK-1]